MRRRPSHAARPDALRDEREAVERDLRKGEGELARLTDALASVLEAIQAREARRADLLARLEHLDGLGKVARLDLGRLADELEAVLTDWRELVAGQAVQARQLLRKLLAGRIVFTPSQQEGVLYAFEGVPTYGRLLAGAVTISMVPKGGLEPPHPCGH